MDFRSVCAVSAISSFLTVAFFTFLIKRRKNLITKKVLFFPGADRNSVIEIDTIISELRKAVRSIDLCLYLLTNIRLVEVLTELLDCGVQIRLVVDKSADEHSMGSKVNSLRHLGVFVRMNCSKDRYLMHHKFAVIDNRTVLFGSFNWTKHAADGNRENLIITNDMELVRPFVKEFDKIWTEYTTLIT